MKPIPLLLIFVLALALGSCTHKRADFETAKAAVAQELRSPDTARFCPADQAEFATGKDARTVRLWVDNRNSLGAPVRTHFEVRIDPRSGRVTGATCLECAAEDEKQKLNEAVTQLQALTSPSK